VGQFQGARPGLRGVVLVRTVSGSDITEGKIKRARLPDDVAFTSDLSEFVMISPDGTHYIVTVIDGGTLSVTAA